mmetsp:Transcript_122063/g.352768  ORF Transcript_122063/g.352768 Transcript_122063/m.352768 type:complete len:317 (-) Transcript_122063:546-1496(-)
MLDRPPGQKGLEDVQNGCELGEHQHLMPEPQHLRKDSVQGLQLPGDPVQVLVMGKVVLEQVGVQGDLPQLHQGVVHLLARDGIVIAKQADRALLEVAVDRGLPRAQGDTHCDLRPWRQTVREHVLLQALQQEGREQGVHASDDSLLLLGVGLDLVLVHARQALERVGEPRLEVHQLREQIRLQVVQQRPQLVQAVLQRRARQQQAHPTTQLLHRGMNHRLRVFQAVAFVHDNKLPLCLEQVLVPIDLLVVGNEGRGPARRCRLAELGHRGLALPMVARQHMHGVARGEAGELRLPIRNYRFRGDDQVRPCIALPLL